MKILIVDDERIARAGLQKMLHSHFGGKVVFEQANSVKAALLMLQDISPDIILLDIKMPQQEGFDLIPQALEVNPYVQIIIVSGYDDFQYSKTAIKHKVYDYILKPVKKEELISVVTAAYSLQKEMKRHEYQVLFRDLGQANIKRVQEIRSCFTWMGGDHPIYFALISFKCHGDREKAAEKVNAALTMREQEFLLLRNNDDRLLFIASNSQGKSSQNLAACLQVCHLPYYRAETYMSGEQIADAYTRLGIASWNRVICKIECQTELVDAQTERIKIKTQFLEQIKYVRERLIVLRREELIGGIRNLLSLKNFQTFQEWHGVVMRLFTDIQVECSLNHLPVNLSKELANALETCRDMDELSHFVEESLLFIWSELKEKGANVSDVMVQRAIKYMQQNYERPLTLDFIADYVHVNPNYFSSVFKKETGKTFLTYLTEIRMKKAKELLESSSLKVQDVAARVGYDNARYFSRIYKNYYNILPRDTKV